MMAFTIIGTVQHQETEMTLDFVFQIVLIDITIKSDVFLRISSFSKSSQSQENAIYKNILYHFNLEFSGVLWGTQGDHVKRCVVL